MKKRLIAFLLAAVLVMGVATGCSNPDGKKLLEDATKKEDQPKGIGITMNFDLGFKLAASELPASMDLKLQGNMEMAASENVTKISMNLNMPSIMGLSMDEECYVDTENNLLYLRTNEGWRQAKVPEGENPLSIISALSAATGGTGDSEQMTNSMASMTSITDDVKTKGKKKFNDVQCYEVEMKLNPETMKTLLSLSMAGMGSSNPLGSMAGDVDEMAEMMGDSMIYTYIGTKDGLMHGLEMDMGPMLKSVLEAQAQDENAGIESLTFDKSEFKLGMISHYKENSITIPDDAKNSNMIDDFDALLNESQLMKSFAQQANLSGGGLLDDDDLGYGGSDYDDIINEDAPRFEEMAMVDKLVKAEDGTLNEIGDEVDEYAQADEEFHVAAQMSNITEPLTVFIDWYKVSEDGGDDQLISSAEVEIASDGDIITSSLAREDAEWPLGMYYVEFTASLKGDGRDKPIELGALLNDIYFFVE